MASQAPRSFLLTVHEPGSAVLEDLRTGQRVHVTELAGLGSQVMTWLEGAGRVDHRVDDPVTSPRDSAHHDV